MIKIGPVTAEILLKWTNVAWTNVMVTVVSWTIHSFLATWTNTNIEYIQGKLWSRAGKRGAARQQCCRKEIDRTFYDRRILGNYSGGKKNKTHKIVISDTKNRVSLVTNFFSNTRSLLVTLYFWIYVKSFSCLPLGSKLLRMEQNNFYVKIQLILEHHLKFICCYRLLDKFQTSQPTLELWYLIVSLSDSTISMLVVKSEISQRVCNSLWMSSDVLKSAKITRKIILLLPK